MWHVNVLVFWIINKSYVIMSNIGQIYQILYVWEEKKDSCQTVILSWNIWIAIEIVVYM